MNNLATTYASLGRHQDALFLQEKTLEFCRRVLPENHPQIGATRCCGWFIEAEVDASARQRNGISCRNVLCPWAASRCSGDEGENAGVFPACVAAEPSGHRCYEMLRLIDLLKG
jgi:hypothetical protein